MKFEEAPAFEIDDAGSCVESKCSGSVLGQPLPRLLVGALATAQHAWTQ
jgi:hypothetical protein